MATPYFFYLSSVVPQRPVASNWLFRVVSTLLSPSSKFIDISTPARIERKYEGQGLARIYRSLQSVLFYLKIPSIVATVAVAATGQIKVNRHA